MIPSTTVSGPLSFEGVGVHSGKLVHLRLLPSPSGRIVFRRTDLGGLEMPLELDRVESRNSTTLVGDRFSVRTVEHLLAALWARGIDSLVIELDAEEVPIMDGSAAPFVRALQASGFNELPFSRAAHRVVHPFSLEDRGASIAFAPLGEDGSLEIAYMIEYDHPAIGVMAKSGPLTWEIFAREIAPARTFGFLKDFEGLKAQGLALGASFENTVVLDENGVVSGPLRFPDEFVRHKLLDLVGDLALLGRPLSGRVAAVKAGHRLHLQAVRYFLDHPEFAAESPAAARKDESK
jgi:UDP-3-O-[3-hydroxymyristoyl] N-acetylglucosamine deacetylase